MMDQQLVSKTYRSIALAWALVMLWTLALNKVWIALSVTLGAALGTALLFSSDVAIRRIVRPGAKKPGGTLLAFILIKFLLIGFALYWLVKWDRINLPAFCGGIVLVHFALLAKLAGIKIVERRAANDSGSAKKSKAIEFKEK
jgi:hypothetical protein